MEHNESSMGILLKFLELLAIIVWLGSLLFFSLIAAPALFRALGKQDAGAAVRTIFPGYYLAGIVSGLVLLGVVAARGTLWGWTGMQPVSFGLFLILTSIVVASRQVLVPAINRARTGGAPTESRFQRLHRISVLLNLFVTLILLMYVFWMASRGY